MNNAWQTVQTDHQHGFPTVGVKRVRDRGVGKTGGEPDRKTSGEVDADHATPFEGSKGASSQARHAEVSGAVLRHNTFASRQAIKTWRFLEARSPTRCDTP